MVPQRRRDTKKSSGKGNDGVTRPLRVRKTSGRATPLRRQLAAGGIKAAGAIAKIQATLKSQGGRMDQAAKKLGVSSRTLSRWLKDHKIQQFASDLRAENNVPGPRPS